MHNISSEQVCWFKRATLYSLFWFFLKSLSLTFFFFFLLDKPGHVFDLIYVPLVRSSADTNDWDEFLGEFEVELLLLHFKRSQLEHLIRSLLGVWALRLLGLKHWTNLCRMAFFHLINITEITNILSQRDAEKVFRAFVISMLDWCNSLLSALRSSLWFLQFLKIEMEAEPRGFRPFFGTQLGFRRQTSSLL